MVDKRKLPRTDDPRFAHVSSDPKFRRPKKNETSVQIDSRFSHMFTDKDFTMSHKMDKYGRKVKSKKGEDLKRFYHLRDDEDDAEKQRLIDRSRGLVPVDNESDDENSSSSSDSEVSEEENVNDTSTYDETYSHPLSAQEAKVAFGSRTKRIAVMNMDWDNLNSRDLFKVISGFVPQTGKLKSVSIYLSEFGKERIEKEELNGPPKEIFKDMSTEENNDVEENSNEEMNTTENDLSVSDDQKLENDAPKNENVEDLSGESGDLDDEEDDDSCNESKPLKPGVDFDVNQETGLIESEAEEIEDSKFNHEALRKYQLERLRYYYAVVECDSVSTASVIYDAIDGTEFEKSSNFFDLRFIPDSTKFSPDYLRDSYSGLVSEDENFGTVWKPKTFSTSALQHSKVKLTWDDDDQDRIKITKAVFSKDKLDEMDFKAFLASSSSEEDEIEEGEKSKIRSLLDSTVSVIDDADKEELSEANYRNSIKKRKKSNDEFTVTFSSGLTDAIEKACFKSKEQEPETVFEAYLKKHQDKKRAYKQQKKDEIQSKLEEIKKQNSRKSADSQSSAELDLLITSDKPSKTSFDSFSDDKRSKKKKKMIKKEKDSFEVDFKDERFSAVFTEPAYAIDPTNPSFKSSKALSDALISKNSKVSLSESDLPRKIKK